MKVKKVGDTGVLDLQALMLLNDKTKTILFEYTSELSSHGYYSGPTKKMLSHHKKLLKLHHPIAHHIEGLRQVEASKHTKSKNKKSKLLADALKHLNIAIDNGILPALWEANKIDPKNEKYQELIQRLADNQNLTALNMLGEKARMAKISRSTVYPSKKTYGFIVHWQILSDFYAVVGDKQSQMKVLVEYKPYTLEEAYEKGYYAALLPIHAKAYRDNPPKTLSKDVHKKVASRMRNGYYVVGGHNLSSRIPSASKFAIKERAMSAAVAANDLIEIEKLLKEDESNISGELCNKHLLSEVEPPIVVAVRRGNLPMVKLFLRYGADPNAIGLNCLTAIEEAMKLDNSLEFLKCLLDAGADPNYRSPYNEDYLVEKRKYKHNEYNKVKPLTTKYSAEALVLLIRYGLAITPELLYYIGYDLKPEKVLLSNIARELVKRTHESCGLDTAFMFFVLKGMNATIEYALVDAGFKLKNESFKQYETLISQKNLKALCLLVKVGYQPKQYAISKYFSSKSIPYYTYHDLVHVAEVYAEHLGRNDSRLQSLCRTLINFIVEKENKWNEKQLKEAATTAMSVCLKMTNNAPKFTADQLRHLPLEVQNLFMVSDNTKVDSGLNEAFESFATSTFDKLEPNLYNQLDDKGKLDQLEKKLVEVLSSAGANILFGSSDKMVLQRQQELMQQLVKSLNSVLAKKRYWDPSTGTLNMATVEKEMNTAILVCRVLDAHAASTVKKGEEDKKAYFDQQRRALQQQKESHEQQMKQREKELERLEDMHDEEMRQREKHERQRQKDVETIKHELEKPRLVYRYYN